MPTAHQLTITLDDETWRRLSALAAASEFHGTLERFVMSLLDHVDQGVYRHGAWECTWLSQVVPQGAIDQARRKVPDVRYEAAIAAVRRPDRD